MKGGFTSVRAFALATAVVLGACHKAAPGASGAPPAAAGIDPCALVTRADAERLLGARVEPGIRSDSVQMATGRDCVYVATAPAGSAAGTWGIGLTVYDDATVRSSDALFKSAADYFHRSMAKLRASGAALVAVPGLGTAAFWQPEAHLLHILDHGVYVVLDVDVEYRVPSGSGERAKVQLQADKRAAEIRLARDAVLPRLAHPAALSAPRPPLGGAGGPSS